jgi:hypothetical protein
LQSHSENRGLEELYTHRFGRENVEGTAYLNNCKCSSPEQVETTPLTQNLRTIKDAKDGTLESDICGKSYGSLRSLKRHATTHSSQKPYYYDKCNKKFSQKYSLKLH